MLAKNLFPSPSPVDAPLTRPAISINSLSRNLSFWMILSFNVSSLLSGTVTVPTLGSIVAMDS
jgi:hypothetical protein